MSRMGRVSWPEAMAQSESPRAIEEQGICVTGNAAGGEQPFVITIDLFG